MFDFRLSLLQLTCLVIHHTQTHTITVIITPMMPPIMAAGMVVTDVPPDHDWSASGPVVTLSVAKCVIILIDLVNSLNGCTGDCI